MKRWLIPGLICATLSWAAHGAEETFSQALRTEDFSAAGLTKLSPAELARLDALVGEFKNTALVAEQKTPRGPIARAKDLPAPNTAARSGTIESRLPGNFTGWEGRPIFTLENGQRWQLAEAGNYFSPPIASPKVKIYPAAFSGFWMTIEGVNQRLKVNPLEDN